MVLSREAQDGIDRKGPLTNRNLCFIGASITSNSRCERTQPISQFLKIRMHAQEECFFDKDVLFEEYLFETVEIKNLMVEGLHQIFARPKAPQCSLFAVFPHVSLPKPTFLFL